MSGRRLLLLSALFAILAGALVASANASASLRFLECDGTYRLFAVVERCRFPAWLQVCGIGSAVVALALFALGTFQIRGAVRKRAGHGSLL